MLPYSEVDDPYDAPASNGVRNQPALFIVDGVWLEVHYALSAFLGKGPCVQRYRVGHPIHQAMVPRELVRVVRDAGACPVGRCCTDQESRLRETVRDQVLAFQPR